jgi:ubiquinone/menaquinone biosynthesis C-methylase UbiE
MEDSIMRDSLNTGELETKVKDMYRQVAENPRGAFHFETGRLLAERLGYPPGDLDRIPVEAIESFAGVGYFFDLAGLAADETVVDLGSGAGMDSFIAGLKVGPGGTVIGIDMTDGQLAKAERLRDRSEFRQVSFRKAYIEAVPVESASVDCVISNGVINLAPDKGVVFAEAARLLKPGGRLAIADIVTDSPLPPTVTCNATLWAACIGGAAQRDRYHEAIEAAGLRVESLEQNAQYRFLSDSARNAVLKWGVRSVSILARKR